RRMLVKIGGVTIKPAEITLVDGLRIVIERAVIAARIPFCLQRGWELQLFGNLERREAVICHAQRLVMYIFVEVALLAKERDRRISTPARPVMACEKHIRLRAEKLNRLVDIPAPRFCIAHLRAARRVDI